MFCLAYACSVGADGDTSRLEATQRAIESASKVAKKNLFGPQLEQQVPLLQHYIASFPVVSMGLLKWIQCNVCDRMYYEKGTHTLSLARFLSLLVDICATQPRQRLLCVDLLRSAYETLEAAQTDEQGLSGEAATVKGSLLSTTVQMLMCGEAEVVSAVLSWTRLLTTRSTTDTGTP